MPSDVRYAVIEKLYLNAGWRLDRVNGSHHVFKAPSGRTESVPVHNRRAKHVYLRKAEDAIAEEQARR